jgi:chlorophyllide a oxygenase
MQEVAEAHQRLHVTEARVQNNLSRINELKQEAAALLAMQTVQTTSSDTTAAGDMPVAQPAPTTLTILDPPRASAPAGGARRPARVAAAGGLQQGFELSSQLAEHWFPVEFSTSLKEDVLVPLELMNETWVLFRDAAGM